MPRPDPLLLRRKDLYIEQLAHRFRLHMGVFFPEVKGKRQPILTEQLDERREYELLRETGRHALLAQQGTMEATFQTAAFLANEDGAIERLEVLEAKFGGNNA